MLSVSIIPTAQVIFVFLCRFHRHLLRGSNLLFWLLLLDYFLLGVVCSFLLSGVLLLIIFFPCAVAQGLLNEAPMVILLLISTEYFLVQVLQLSELPGLFSHMRCCPSQQWVGSVECGHLVHDLAHHGLS